MFRITSARSGPWAVLLVTVSLLWMYTTDRWSPSDWLLPAGDSGDAIEVATRVQIASENGLNLANTYGQIDRLGYPGPANWTLYPAPDRPTFWMAGQIARWTGPWGAVNLMTWFGYLLAAAGFYGLTRLLRWQRSWGLAGAILFAYSSFNFRWAQTLSLSYTFAWPLTLLIFRWIVGRSRPAQSSRWHLLAGATGALLGAANPYFTFIAGQLGLGAWLRARNFEQPLRRRAGSIFLVALVVSFACSHSSFLWATLRGERSTTLQRNYQGTELYALRPIELIMPTPNHWSPSMARVGRSYSVETMFKGPEPSSYIGIVAAVGLVGLAISTALRLNRGRPYHRILPESTWAASWVLLFSGVGGLNALLGFAGVDLFRASNRNSIVLLVVGLFFALNWLRKRTRSCPRIGTGLAVAITLLGLWDQLPPPPATINRTAIRNHQTRQTETVAALVTATRADASVFQLPAVPFPEAGTVLGFNDYEHLRLFLHSTQLRFSYGGLRGSYSERLSRWLSQLDNDDLVPALEECGFHLLVIDRRAYIDNADRLIATVTSSGRPRIELPLGSPLAAFALHPNAEPHLLDPTDPRLLDRWDPASRSPSSRRMSPGSGPNSGKTRPMGGRGDRPTPLDSRRTDNRRTNRHAAGIEVFARSGWLEPEWAGPSHWRWAKSTTPEISFYDDDTDQTELIIEFDLASIQPRNVTIRWRDREIWHGTVGETPLHLQLPVVEFADDLDNNLSFFSPEGLVRPRYDTRDLGLKVIDLRARYRDRD